SDLGAQVVRDLGPAEEPQRPPHSLERGGRDLLAVLLLAEREQQVLGLAELLPVQLEEPRRVEERAGRIDVNEVRPVAPNEVARVLGEDDPHERPLYRRGGRSPAASPGAAAS